MQNTLEQIRLGLDPQVLELRRAAFGYSAIADVTDEFDPSSTHFVLLENNLLAAAVRFTPSPPSVLEAWSGGRLTFTRGYAHAAEMSRAAVAPAFRGRGIYKELMTRALAHARQAGIENLFGVVASDHAYLLEFWAKMGAKKIGAPSLFKPLNCVAQSGQPIHIALAK